MADVGVNAVVAIVQQQAIATVAELSLAADLGLQTITEAQLPESEADFYLRFQSGGLGLYRNRDEKTGAVRVDFGSGAIRRRAGDSLRRQSLSKAVGIKAGATATVLDATAGLGRDSYLLARSGCEVTMLERSAVLHALLLDGIRRGTELKGEEGRAVARLQLHQGDFLEMNLSSDQFDVVYLDPMFPQTKQRALVKKELQLLKELLGPQSGENMLSRAKAVANRRVVVKRSKKSPWLDDARPDLSLSGRSSRYDVYMS